MSRIIEGKPCKHGHGNLRYWSTMQCIECVANNIARNMERRSQAPECQQAKAAGLTHYKGPACVVCGSRSRYVRNHQCVLCQRERSKARAQRLEAERRSA